MERDLDLDESTQPTYEDLKNQFLKTKYRFKYIICTNYDLFKETLPNIYSINFSISRFDKFNKIIYFQNKVSLAHAITFVELYFNRISSDYLSYLSDLKPEIRGDLLGNSICLEKINIDSNGNAKIICES